MSAESSHEPLTTTPLSDEQLLRLHEQVLEEKHDDRGVYHLLPLGLLFFFSGLIFFGGTYLNRFSGHFSPAIFDERAKPHVGGVAAAPIDPIPYGKKQYDSLCTTCHQPTGLGVPGVFPPLAGSEWVNGSEERVVRILLNGLKGPITVEGHNFGAAGTAPMPVIGPGGQGWNDERIADVLTYVRQAFGNTASAITPEKVAEVRGQVGTRPEWSADELQKIP
jgi:mono/diheme cytochrome c family protein